jgi:hypothetical protein
MRPIHRAQPVTGGKRTGIRGRLTALVEEVRNQVPSDLSEEEIEREAQEAVEEARRERRARRL